MGDVINAAVAVVGVPLVLIGYIVIGERLLGRLQERRQRRVRPWLWLAPALAFLGVFLVYPTINTIILSFQNSAGDAFVGFANYEYFFGTGGGLSALKNNALWLVFFSGLAVGLGLLIAVLVDRFRYESLAKTVIFLPLAISFVGAGVIWSFMYALQTPPAPQTGTLNALIVAAGGNPVAWMPNSTTNNPALITVGAWMWTGFCMVILSANLKSISPELLEAARVDGANEWQVFRRIVFPLLLPSIYVVGTTMIITALKAFDIVYVMTNGAFDTDVVANMMYREMFSNSQFGRASAVAVILFVAIVPFMLLNIRRFREQEAQR
jgi:alpha-glucoside transport system permease protein